MTTPNNFFVYDCHYREIILCVIATNDSPYSIFWLDPRSKSNNFENVD